MSKFSLRQLQSVFAVLTAKLILYALSKGYEVTFGEAYRSKEEAERLAKLGVGIKNSLHTQRLAIDLNLFKEGKYLSSSESHKFLGEWWEKQSNPPLYLCAWGGRFGDGNHYSIEFDGRK